MDREEELAKNYLEHRGYQKVEFEPDGNIPPDFSVNDKIGIEVRRLNQHFHHAINHKGLEDLKYKLLNRINKLLRSYNILENELKYFVSIEFKRPLKISKQLIGEIREILDYMLTEIKNEKKLQFEVRTNLKLIFAPGKKNLESIFTLGTIIDLDSGGFVLGNLTENLRIVVDEKDKKIQPYLERYNEWWLILIDYIGYRISDFEVKLLKTNFSVESEFKKIIMISPIDHKRAVEIEL